MEKGEFWCNKARGRSLVICVGGRIKTTTTIKVTDMVVTSGFSFYLPDKAGAQKGLVLGYDNVLDMARNLYQFGQGDYRTKRGSVSRTKSVYD